MANLIFQEVAAEDEVSKDIDNQIVSLNHENLAIEELMLMDRGVQEAIASGRTVTRIYDIVNKPGVSLESIRMANIAVGSIAREYKCIPNAALKASLESNDTNIALEGFIDFISDILKAIWDTILKCWNYIVSGFKSASPDKALGESKKSAEEIKDIQKDVSKGIITTVDELPDVEDIEIRKTLSFFRGDVTDKDVFDFVDKQIESLELIKSFISVFLELNSYKFKFDLGSLDEEAPIMDKFINDFYLNKYVEGFKNTFKELEVGSIDDLDDIMPVGKDGLLQEYFRGSNASIYSSRIVGLAQKLKNNTNASITIRY